MLKEKLKEARKWASIMDSMSQKGQHSKAERAFKKLHAIYLRLIANWYKPTDHKL